MPVRSTGLRAREAQGQVQHGQEHCKHLQPGSCCLSLTWGITWTGEQRVSPSVHGRAALLPRTPLSDTWVLWFWSHFASWTETSTSQTHFQTSVHKTKCWGAAFGEGRNTFLTQPNTAKKGFMVQSWAPTLSLKSQFCVMICLALYHDRKFGDRLHVSQKTHSQIFVRKEREKESIPVVKGNHIPISAQGHFQTGIIKYTITRTVEPSLCWYQKSSIFRDSHFANYSQVAEHRDARREHRIPTSTQRCAMAVASQRAESWQVFPWTSASGAAPAWQLKNIYHHTKTCKTLPGCIFKGFSVSSRKHLKQLHNLGLIHTVCSLWAQISACHREGVSFTYLNYCSSTFSTSYMTWDSNSHEKISYRKPGRSWLCFLQK